MERPLFHSKDEVMTALHPSVKRKTLSEEKHTNLEDLQNPQKRKGQKQDRKPKRKGKNRIESPKERAKTGWKAQKTNP
jgi:hypothetical protein